jgi:hypothetical protein
MSTRIFFVALILVLAALACSFPFAPDSPGLDYSILTPSPGATLITGTPAPPTDTPIPPTSTIDPNAPITFNVPTVVPTQFFTGDICAPDQQKIVNFDVKVDGPLTNVKEVDLYVRARDLLTGTASDWRGPLAMKPQGGGRYTYTFVESKLPQLPADKSLLQFQFIVIGYNEKVIARSDVFGNKLIVVVCR